MAIHQIGSHSSTALESSTNRHSTGTQNAKIAYDSAHSSIVSLSQAQEEGGIGDFFYNLGSGVWSIATWPFRTVASGLSSVWSWITGGSSPDVVNEQDDEEKGGGGGSSSKSKSSKGTAKRTPASADFVEFFKVAKEDGEFDLPEFKKAFKALSPEEKKCFENLLLKAGNFQSTTGSKTWAKKQIETHKKDYPEETQKLMHKAAVQYKVIPDVKKLGDRYTKLANNELKNLDDEDSELNVAEEKRSIKKAYERLPDAVKREVKTCAGYYAPHPTLAVVSKKDKDNWDERRDILATKGRAHVMQTFAKNSMLFVSDPNAREDIETMVRVIGVAIKSKDAPFGLTDANFATAYKNMSKKEAREAYANIIGFAIGRPGEGEKYLNGKLKVDGKRVDPDVGLLGRKLAELANHDGIKPHAHFAVFFPKKPEPRVDDHEGGDGHGVEGGPREGDGPEGGRRKRDLEEGEEVHGEEPLDEEGEGADEVERSEGHVIGDEGEEDEVEERGRDDADDAPAVESEEAPEKSAAAGSRAANLNKWKKKLTE